MMRIFFLCFALVISSVQWSSAAKPIGNFPAYFHSKPKAPPEINFKDKNDSLYSLSHYKGKVILVNIWATWCKPCIEEMPALDRLQQKAKNHGIEVVPISIDTNKSPEQIRKFLSDLNVSHLPVLIDHKRSYAKNSIAGLPTTLILNRKGQEIGRVVGAIDWEAPDVLEYLKKQ